MAACTAGTSEAIAQAMAQVDDAAYTTSAAAFADLRQQLRLESLAALAVLMEAGAAEAVILLDCLGGQEAVRSVVGSVAARARNIVDGPSSGIGSPPFRVRVEP